MLKTALLAGALLATGVPNGASDAVASPPTEQVIKIGILDTAASNINGYDGRTTVQYREFARPGFKSGRWKMEGGADHGEVMANVFVNQIRSMDKSARIQIYSANVTEMHPHKVGKLLFNPDGAREALKWFSQNGVKTVMTTMVGQDSESMRAFMDEAGKLNMTVFASAGNQVQRGVPAYPAAYPQAISIAGDGVTLALRNDPSVSRWVNFAVDGNMKLNRESNDGPTNTEGSSMAVARASAIGAYAVYTGKAYDRVTMLEALRSIAQPRSYKVKDHPSEVSVSYIDRKSAGVLLQRFAGPSAGSSMAMRSPSLQAQIANAQNPGQSR